MIPLVDVRAQYAPLLGELKEQARRGGRLRPVHSRPERGGIRAGSGCPSPDVARAIGVANGTDALVLALDALGVGPGRRGDLPLVHVLRDGRGDRAAGGNAGLLRHRARLAEPRSGRCRRARHRRARRRSSPCTCSAGRPRLDGLPEGIPIIEDAAQAFGALRASGRTAAWPTFSFFPTKNLPALGDGGLVTTDDSALADRIRLLRFHGSRDKQTFEAVGYNSRLDELQAAALRLFLTRLDAWNAARREAAARYAELGLGEACELPADEPGHVYHLYVVRTPERDRVASALAEAGIGCASYYRTPLHLQPVFAELGYAAGSLPETEHAARQNLALPIWAGISVDQQQQVVERVLSAAAVGVTR